MRADQTIPLTHRLIAKLHLKSYKSLIKLLACVSTHSNANVFLIRWLSEKSFQSLEGP